VFVYIRVHFYVLYPKFNNIEWVCVVGKWKMEKNLEGTGCVDWELSIFF